MTNKTTMLQAALASVIAIGLAQAAEDAKTSQQAKEKCYGVAKAGQNDCGTASLPAPARRRRTTCPRSGNTSRRARARSSGARRSAGREE
jgi:uncharacterized membrane protein